jgi:hypothetical protein
LARNENLFAVLTDVAAFPTGVEFSILARFGPGITNEPPGPGRRMWMPFHLTGPDGPRLGIGSADGRKAVSGIMRPTPLGEPDHPVLLARSGGGGGDEWRQGFWLWPLPPPGPLLVVISGGGMGIGERSVTLDASELVTAAEHAEQLWEIEPNEMRRGGWRSGGGQATTMRFEGRRRAEEKPEGKSGG